MRKFTVLSFSLLFLATAAVAQHDQKAPLSPPAKAEAAIGTASLSVDYSAPSVRGRKVMGELVPWGKVWRTGANAATTFRTSSDVMLGDLHVPAGAYTLYTIPGESEWTLIVSRQTGQWGSRYDQAQDLGRVSMKVGASEAPVETFTIGIKPKDSKSGVLTLAWENTVASVPVTVH